jgi:hypothetical protein
VIDSETIPAGGVRSATARLLLASAVLALTSGCIGPSGRELHEAARSLVPARSDVVEEVEADCVELARSPSCVHIYFLAPTLARDERAKAVQNAARAAGWEAVRAETFVGGTQLRFRRRGLRAVVNIWPEERARDCRDAPAKDCADSAFVEPE